MHNAFNSQQATYGMVEEQVKGFPVGYKLTTFTTISFTIIVLSCN